MQALLSLGSCAERVEVQKDPQTAVVVVGQAVGFPDNRRAVTFESRGIAKGEIASALVSCSLLWEKSRSRSVGRHQDGQRLGLQLFVVKAVV